MNTIYRIIVFLVVGVLALVISFLYILLEKNADKKKAEKLSWMEQGKQALSEEQTTLEEQPLLKEQIISEEQPLLGEQIMQEERKFGNEEIMD